MLSSLDVLLLLPFLVPGHAVQDSLSRVIFNEFANLTEEQAHVMAYNYTEQLFKPDRPLVTRLPTVFAFSPSSPLRSLLPSLREVNKGLEVPDLFDFHQFPRDDVLTPLYQFEQSVKGTKKIVLGKIRDPYLVDKDHMAVMLENAFTFPRHAERNSSLADSIGQYIMRKFGSLGLLTGTQVFRPSQFHSMFWDEDEDIPQGSNIIGIYPGKHFGTAEDKIILVGAHWDTTGFTDGYNDNGSGVAGTIEVARALAESGCQLLYTVFFVAFDKEEVGSQGSHEFVRSYLVPTFFSGPVWPEFQGALILDTVMNYNQTEGSQKFPASWADKVVGGQQVEQDGGRGNFISLVSRLGPEKVLADKVQAHWNNLALDQDYRELVSPRPSLFKLRRFEVELGAELPSVKTLAEHIHFLRSDHARFWYSNESDYQLSLRGLLFTDTGPYRGKMAECYHRECDSKRMRFKGEFANYDFLAQTVQTVVDTVGELAGAECSLSDRQKRMAKHSANKDKEARTTGKTEEAGDETEESVEEGEMYKLVQSKESREEGREMASGAMSTPFYMNSHTNKLSSVFSWVPVLRWYSGFF